MSVRILSICLFLNALAASASEYPLDQNRLVVWTTETASDSQLWLATEGPPIQLNSEGSILRDRPAMDDRRVVWVEEVGEKAFVKIWSKIQSETDVLCESKRGSLLDPALGEWGIAWSQLVGNDWQVVGLRNGERVLYGEADADDVVPVVGETGIAWVETHAMHIWAKTTIGNGASPKQLPGLLPSHLWARGDTLFWRTPAQPNETLWTYRDGKATPVLQDSPAISDLVPDRVRDTEPDSSIRSATLTVNWNEVPIPNPIPEKRTTHCTLGVGESKVMIFGGEVINPEVGYTDHVDSQTWIVDLAKNQFEQIEFSEGPEPRCHIPLAYDPSREVTLLWGGAGFAPETGFFFYDDTWLFDVKGREWKRLPAEGAPPAGSDFGLVHDPKRDRFVLYHRGEVWQFQIEGSKWTKLETGPGPAPRTCSAVLLDPVGDRLMIWGGALHPRYFDDTWFLDLETLTWTEARLGPHPKPRVRSSLGYDPRRHRVIAYGGVQGPHSERFRDLWAFDLKKNRWELLEASNPVSPGRRGGLFGMPYLSSLDRFYLFGGRSGTSSYHNDSWLLQISD